MSRLVLLLLLFLTSCTSLRTFDVFDKVDSVKLYDNVVIEILPSADYTPTSQMLEKFKNTIDLMGICDSSGVHFVIRKAPPTTVTQWTYSLICAYEYDYRSLYDLSSKDRSLIMFVACLPGQVIEESRADIIGLFYKPTSFAYFTRDRGLNDLAIWTHEFGHLVGLVNPKGRDAPINLDRPDHCNDESCIMYWRCGRSLIFCDLCRRDLKQIIRLNLWMRMARTRFNLDRPQGDNR